MILSIITVCYNNLLGLTKTVNSINYDNAIEHLVIDGHSDDGTIDYLKSLKNPKITWISEPDDGIYDAMNKGLKMAMGEYVIFMNSGDLFFDEGTIGTIINRLKTEKPDILYGEAMYIDAIGNHLGLRSNITTRKLPQSLQWNDMKAGMLVCHQSFIAKRSLAPYYIQDNLSADIDWQIKCLKSASSVVNFEKPICQYLVGGTSQQQHRKSLTDRYLVMKQHYGTTKTIWYHLMIILRALRFKLLH